MHWQQGLFARKFKKLPSDYFIAKYSGHGVSLKAVYNDDRSPALCRICGFALGSLKLSDDWILETCSLMGVNGLIDEGGGKCRPFAEWVRQLGQLPGAAIREDKLLTINLVSFGYKFGSIPEANLLFDMRFLDNPYWVDNLRPLTGLDKSVQNYVLEQVAAKQFLASFFNIIDIVLPPMKERDSKIFTIAFGCTGGQHRSVSLVEYVACALKEKFGEPGHIIKVTHRELERNSPILQASVELRAKEQKP